MRPIHIVLLILLSICLCSGAFAQTRTATLSWSDTLNPAGRTYSVYRAAGACPASGTLAGPPIATGLTAQSYSDSTVSIGTTYCYAVTAVVSSTESTQTQGSSQVQPYPVTTLTIVVK